MRKSKFSKFSKANNNGCKYILSAKNNLGNLFYYKPRGLTTTERMEQDKTGAKEFLSKKEVIPVLSRMSKVYDWFSNWEIVEKT